jgi:acetyl esterase/lipase
MTIFFCPPQTFNIRYTLFALFALLTAQVQGQIIPTHADVSYVADNLAAHKLDIYIPPGMTTAAPCIIQIHGGGWQGGAKGNAMNWCDSMYYNGYIIADINYRLSGEAIFPAQIYDCKAAVRFLKANASLYGIDTCKIGLIGQSAGGHLVGLMGTSGGVNDLEDFSLGNSQVSSRVHAVVDLYGPTDFTVLDPFVPDSCSNPLIHNSPNSPESKLVGCDISLPSCLPAIRWANPIAYISPDDPPFLIRHGGVDCTVTPYSSQILHDTLLLNGISSNLVIVPGAGHGGPFGGNSYVSEYLTFFDEKLKNAPSCVTASSGPNYPPPSGVYCSCAPTTGTGSGSVAPGIAQKTFVKGILVRVAWNLLEPSDDTYNWALIDGQIAAAKSYGKKISLGIGNGPAIPEWVYTAGAQKLESNHPNLGMISLAVPWDSAFLQKWTDFIAQLGARYQQDTTISLVYITNSTSNGIEMQVPNVVTPSWSSVGYTDEKITGSWKTVIDAFGSAFPNHYLSNDFHPVNGSNAVADSVYAYGRERMPDQYGAAAWWWTQHNTTVYPEQYEILQQSAQSAPFSGIQMAHNGTTDSIAFGTGGMPAALQLAIDQGVCYWEIWNQDILNPNFEDLLTTAACGTVSTAEDLSEQPGITIFPNPNHGIFTVEFMSDAGSGDMQVLLFSADGRLVRQYQMETSGAQLLDFSGTPAGLYLVQIRLENGAAYREALVILD